MLKGLSKLEGFSDQFTKTKPYVKGMIVYSGINYAMDLFGIWSILSIPCSYIWGLISTIFSLLISYKIIAGIKDIEIVNRQNLNSDQLYSTWKLLAILLLISYALYLIPVFFIICILISLVVEIYYLYVFNKTKNMFIQQNTTI